MSFIGSIVRVELFAYKKSIFHSEAISLARKGKFRKKSTHCLGRQMCAFFCEETRKRCVDVGKNAKKVRESNND